MIKKLSEVRRPPKWQRDQFHRWEAERAAHGNPPTLEDCARYAREAAEHGSN